MREEVGDSRDAHEENTTCNPGLRSTASLIRREEEQSSETDTLNVQRHKDGPERFDVELTTSLHCIGLIGRPYQEVLVRRKEHAKGDESEDSHEWLDHRVDDGDAEEQTLRGV